MIAGYLEDTDIPWEVRLGEGMRQTSGETIEDIIFSHRRESPSEVITTHLKEGVPYMECTYLLDEQGRTIKETSAMFGEPPHWIYTWDYNPDESVGMTRTDPEGQVSTWKMVVTEHDSAGRILAAEQRSYEDDACLLRIRVERDAAGRIVKQVAEDTEEPYTLLFYLDAEGRYLRMEHYYEGKLTLIQDYLH